MNEIPKTQIPKTQVALQIIAADETALNTAKPVPEPGPDADPVPHRGHRHLLQ